MSLSTDNIAPLVTRGISSFNLNILLFLNLALSLLRHMANHYECLWDRWPMVMTLTQSRVKPRKTTRRLVWFSPIRALRVRRTCEEEAVENERRYEVKRTLTFPDQVVFVQFNLCFLHNSFSSLHQTKICGTCYIQNICIM